MASPPRASFVIEQNYFIEPLGGSQSVQSYLDAFPEEVYSKGLDSHLVKFLYSLLGPVGVGSIRRNYLEARLIFEAHGLELTDLDRFYGNPFQFSRIEEETYNQDVTGLLSQDEWEKVRAKDARYRNRIIDFLSGARAGNTPFGMRLVARSGLGHEVEIIENYRYLYDSHSDDPLGLDYFGTTRFINEMIILPRQELGISEAQQITFTGTITGGSFRIALSGTFTDPISYDATRQVVETALETLTDVEHGDVEVTGGPAPTEPLTIRFLGRLADKDVASILVSNELLGTNPQIVTATTTQGFDAASEIVDLSPGDQHHLQEALDRIRPVAVIPTVAPASGTKSSITWIRSGASSVFDEMVRYVTGSGTIQWPTVDGVHWIEGGVEHQAPRPHGELPYNYQAFHQIRNIDSYDESFALEISYEEASWHNVKARYASNHIGGYEIHHSAIFSFLRNIAEDEVATADRAKADYAEPLVIDRVIESTGGSVALINGVYPADYQTLAGAPQIVYKNEQFWSSRERTEGDEYLEIDLGESKGVNYLIFETTRKPMTIEVSYDLLDQGEARSFHPVTFMPEMPAPTTLPFSPLEQNPWQQVEYYMTNSLGEMIFTRYLRIKFSRTTSTEFLTNSTIKYPWSVDVRNLRIGRNVTNQ